MRRSQYTLAAALVVVAAFVVGLFVSDAQHRGDFDDGWQDGYGASQAAQHELDQRVVAAGLCSYAKLACRGAK